MATGGVDGLYVGPGDLSLSLGCAPDPDDPVLDRALQRLWAASAAAGKPVGVHATDGATARRYREADPPARPAAQSKSASAVSIPGGYGKEVELRLLRYFAAVAEERHVGRAADRLHMTQPPLSRAIRQLERELDVELLERTPKGVELTPAGTVLHREARAILDRAERLPARIAAAAGTPTITVGTCADTADQVGSRLVTEFRRQHPHVELTLHETDLTDPTAGLRAGLVDVALTRAPFDDTDIASRQLRSDPVGVVVLDDDPLAHRESVSLTELHDRRWIRLPEGTDPVWSAYWMGEHPAPDGEVRPIARTIQECLQSVLWSNASTLAPLNQALPDGLVNVPVADKNPSQLVVAWKPTAANPLVRAFIEIAVAISR